MKGGAGGREGGREDMVCWWSQGQDGVKRREGGS